MDANKDGVVTKDELRTLLKGLGEEVTEDVVDEMINIADENGDGKVQFEEFCKAASSGAMWAPTLEQSIKFKITTISWNEQHSRLIYYVQSLHR